MAGVAMPKHIDYISPARQRGMGITFLLIGLLIGLVFARAIGEDSVTRFVMTPGGSSSTASDLVFSTRPVLMALSAASLALGAYQLTRGFGKRTNLALGLVAVLFVFGFLSWIASGGSLNLVGLLRSMVVRAVPIALGAFAALLNERAGVVNIAIEGMMLMGAMVGALVGSLANLWVGLLAAVAAGALMGWIHGILSIKYKADQIISSTLLLIFATGMTSFISARFMQKYQFLNNPGIFPNWAIPGLSKIPVLGPMFLEHNLFTYSMFFFLVLLHIALFYTRWGLRLRSVGEHPKAADTLGINVFRTRYMAVTLSGMMAGFAGAYFTLGSVGRFDEVMTAGRGFIGLAAMIFGNWTPAGSFGAAMLFGFADSLSAKLGILGVSLPSEFLLMAPYLATMIVLAGVVGKGNVPAASGRPYEKEEM
jgi:simple sugar transport system permease protein